MDLIDELRLRRWARTHHVPAAERPRDWDPVVLDEMRRKDAEAAVMTTASPLAPEVASDGFAPEDRIAFDRAHDAPTVPTRYGYVPLVPDSHLNHFVHPAHTRLADPKLLKRIERLAAEEEMAGARKSAENAPPW